jgi:hypothetical protein
MLWGNDHKTYIPYAIRQDHLLFLIDISVENEFGYWLHFKGPVCEEYLNFHIKIKAIYFSHPVIQWVWHKILDI